jgi:hypothetical protein
MHACMKASDGSVNTTVVVDLHACIHTYIHQVIVLIILLQVVVTTHTYTHTYIHVSDIHTSGDSVMDTLTSCCSCDA